jgi:hypothetical protein
MSADTHRGIRRIKQKRAKALKKLEREQRSAGVAQTRAGLAAPGPSAECRCGPVETGLVERGL